MTKDTNKDNRFNKIIEWQAKMGISAITNVDESEVNTILSLNSNKIFSMDVRKLQYYLLVLSRYKLYILKELGILKSRIDILSRKLEVTIDAAASKYSAQAKNERRALAMQHNDQVGVLMEKLEAEEIKYTQLKNLPDGIQSFIDKIDRVEYRKSNEKKVEDRIND